MGLPLKEVPPSSTVPADRAKMTRDLEDLTVSRIPILLVGAAGHQSDNAAPEAPGSHGASIEQLDFKSCEPSQRIFFNLNPSP